MTSAAGSLTALHFSTRNLPRGMRPLSCHEIFGRALARRACLLSDAASHVDFSMWPLAWNEAAPRLNTGACVLHVMLTGGLASQRTPALLADGCDDVSLNIQVKGRGIASQLGREAIAEAGSGFLTSDADVSKVVLPEASHFVSISMPRRLMMSLVPGLEDTLVRPLAAGAGPLRLLVAYLSILEDHRALQTPELQRTVAAHIHDLCALAIGATRDAAEIARRRGVRAARLRVIKTDIARDLADAGLSAATLAWRQRVTARYIHKLFENEGTTLSKYVLALRLERVHGTLCDPRHAHRSISALAYDTGFGDLSTFNRQFRRHFGATPSDIRAATGR